MSNKYKHCCDTMEFYATEKNSLVEYDREDRSYSFFLYKDSRGTNQIMHYCPWCGSKIPKDLRDIWVKILQEEYGLKEPYLNRDKLPREFLSDEWWKKRKL